MIYLYHSNEVLGNSRFFHNRQKKRGRFFLLPKESGNQEQIKSKLQELFNSKCTYCEEIDVSSDYPNQNILLYRPPIVTDHPTRLYTWLSWQWPNMLFVCPTCNRTRNDRFEIKGGQAELGTYSVAELQKELPLLLNPCFINPADYFYYEQKLDDENKIYIKTRANLNQFEKECANYTIDILKLNRENLLLKRAQKWDEFAGEIKKVVDFDQNQTDVVEDVNQLITACEIGKEFAGMKRCFLQKWLDEHEDETSGVGWQAVREQLEVWREETAVYPQPYPLPTDSVSLPPTDLIPPLPPSFSEKPSINMVKIFNKMQDEESIIILELILKKMFPNVDVVIVKGVFNTGFSGAQLFHVQPKEGRRTQLPRVVKIDKDHKVEKEFEKGNSVKKFVSAAIVPLESIEKSGMGWSGIQYKLGGDGNTNIMSLKQYLMEASLENIHLVLKERLFRTMKQFWSEQADYGYFWRKYDVILPANLEIQHVSQTVDIDFNLTPRNLLQFLPKVEVGDYVTLSNFTQLHTEENEINFNLSDQTCRLKMIVPEMELIEQNMRHPSTLFYGKVIKTRHSILLEKIKQAYEQIRSEKLDLNAEHIILPDKAQVINPLHKIDEMLNDHSDVYISNLIHGDLNLENVLVEYDPNNYPTGIALIDFATIREGDHVLHDFLRLEASIWLYIVTAEISKKGLEQKISLLFQAAHVEAPLSKDFDNLQSLRILRQIRYKAIPYLKEQPIEEKRWEQYYKGLALYMLGALKYGNLDDIKMNPSPKLLAFWVACLAYHYVEHGDFDGLVSDDSPRDVQPLASAHFQASKESHSLTKDAEPETLFLHDQIDEYFNEGELIELCLEIEVDIDYENLAGKTRKIKVMELVQYCDRRGKIAQLLTYCKNERPQPYLNWDSYKIQNI